jgi:hypothetical protein
MSVGDRDKRDRLSASNVTAGAAIFNVSAVTSALDTVNALNTTQGSQSGTSVTISGNTTIDAADGVFSVAGAGYTNVRFFDVSSISLNGEQNLTIHGDANGDPVVLTPRTV